MRVALILMICAMFHRSSSGRALAFPSSYGIRLSASCLPTFFVGITRAKRCEHRNKIQTEAWLESNFPPLEVYLENDAEHQTKFIGCASLLQPANEEIFADACRNLENYDYIGFSECTEKLPAVIATDFPELLQTAMPTENVTPKSGNGLWRNRIEPKLLDKVRSRFDFDLRLYEGAIKLNLRRGHPVP